ncbi:MAG: hypothetical protein OEY86_04475 [Nitrospira sp.]|nr:hypothetical protein [Nitrospira sp.]
MGHKLRGQSSRVRYGTVLLLISTLVTTPGCITTLGYVPEQIKPADKITYRPTYSEVKKWANDVVDGYDSRASINRDALYVGALLAAVGVGALTGLAIYDSTSSWIKGIPIGTAFLGSVFGIYSNEEKAEIYRLGSKYASDLVIASDQRLISRQLASNMTATALQEAQTDENNANTELDNVKAQQRSLNDKRNQALTAAHEEAEGPEKLAKTKTAQAIEREVAKVAAAVAAAESIAQAARERTLFAQRQDDAWKELSIAQTTNDQARIKAANATWKQLTNHEEAEALCLRADIFDLMRRVDEHKALLDPKNLADRLKKVQASGPTPPDAQNATSNAPSPITPVNLSDLEPPVKSRCDNAVRGGFGNSDNVIRDSLASPKPPSGGKHKERGDEANATESQSGL